VEAAKEVAKPRTWHAVAEGSVAMQADPPVRDCVVGQETPGEAASRGESRVGPSGPAVGRRCGAGLLWHVSEGARKRKEGRQVTARSRATARRTNTRGASKRQRVGRKPIAVLVRRAPSPRSAAQPREAATGHREVVSGPHASPQSSGGPPRSRTWTPSSGSDDRTKRPVEHRWTVAPGSEPRNRDCIAREGAQSAVGITHERGVLREVKP
jgi:hypothetical protein